MALISSYTALRLTVEPFKSTQATSYQSAAGGIVLKLDNPITATFAGLLQQLDRRRPTGLSDADSLDGRVCLVTGASSGLGKATAIALARRGARVLMACRSGIPEAGDEVRRLGGSDAVEMLPVDLSDFASVQKLCDTLRDRGVRIDVLVCNAGVVPSRARRTRDGFEQMFQVNFLANVLLTRRLLQDGVIPNRVFANNGVDAAAPRPRIVIVSSETHRSAKPLQMATLGDYVEYGPMTSVAHYGHTKLLLCTFATELGRRLSDARGVDVAVHALCPGPVNSNMAREAPRWLAPLLKPMMRVFFSSPEVASRPVVYLACARALEGQTSRYLHLMRQKEPAPAARDATVGKQLWDRSSELLQRAGAGA
jgi:NAD(P)-dependent dehydrogenase (short-subunit alcohol dehydrogenase family)